MTAIELGKAEVIRWGSDGNILACGTLLHEAVKASDQLQQDGLDVGIINARFVKPVDTETVTRALETGFVMTLEENTAVGGFGSAVLETANAAGVSTERVHVAAVPDSFIEHGDRAELLEDLRLDAAGLRQRVLAIAGDVAAVEA